jgi:hypothetical protein
MTSLVTGTQLDEESRKRLHEKLGRELPAEIWEYQMTGARILVVPEPVAERTRGMLYKPRSAVERESLEMGSGWVIAVGPWVGDPNSHPPYPGGVDGPGEALLGHKILYRSHQGVSIKTSDEDPDYGGQYALLCMTDRDVLCWGEKV